MLTIIEYVKEEHGVLRFEGYKKYDSQPLVGDFIHRDLNIYKITERRWEKTELVIILEEL